MKQNHHNAYRVCTVIAGVLLTLLICMPGASLSAAEVLLVPDDYPTIQEAVDAANPGGGDTIFIGPGEFVGAVITNSVKIIGSGAETVITSGTWLYDEDAFDIIGSAFDVNETEIRNLMIDGDDLLWGFWLYMAHNVTIANVTVNHALRGVDAYFSDGLTISGSTFNNPYVGLFAWYGDGLTISGNTINDSYRAIDTWFLSDCEIMHNNVMGLKARYDPFDPISHSDGIALFETNNCVIGHNNVRHDGVWAGIFDEEFYVGIALGTFGSPTEGNNFHHNRVEVSVTGEVPDIGRAWSGAHIFIDYGVVEYGLPISIKENKLMHNNFLGSDQGEFFEPLELADYNVAKFNLFDE